MTVKTLRARQAEGTRQLLISVASELFTERGYAATSIEDIIQRAGVAKGALYHHFSGNDACSARSMTRSRPKRSQASWRRPSR